VAAVAIAVFIFMFCRIERLLRLTAEQIGIGHA